MTCSLANVGSPSELGVVGRRRFKELVDEVRNGMECGIAVKQYNDVKPGDQIECFERTEVARTL